VFKLNYGSIVPENINREAPTGLVDGLMTFAKEGGAADSAVGANGLAVAKAEAMDAALASVKAVAGATVIGAAAVTAAALAASPQTKKQVSHGVSGVFGLFGSCCTAGHVDESFDVGIHTDERVSDVEMQRKETGCALAVEHADIAPSSTQ